ncbi:MAG: SulP family inorganic anion transporter [Lentisphaeraceae bacterium]|nr:SulP family inorganic anion transporter [Lentisphaeraceae bacterium]
MIHVQWKQLIGAGLERFRPALWTCLREGYSWKTFAADLVAGLIVAAVALPLAIAFSIAAGLPPQAGMVTAVVAGVAISLFGGCRVQIGGPTGAFIVIIYGVYSQFGATGLLAATVMAGIILVLLGLCGLGSIIKYIPYPVTVGFTSGIALIIFAGQIEALLGLDCTAALAGAKMPGDFVGKLAIYAKSIATVNWAAVAISAITLVICIYWKKVTKRVPGSIVAIVLTTIIALVLKRYGLEVATIGSKFPEVSGGMGFAFPKLDWSQLDIRALFSPAISIALLAGIESLLSAVVADGMIGKRHNSNTELIGQGIANILSPLFGGIPATGAIARTATNIKNGGQTPVAGILHALFLLLVMLFLGRYAALVPMATLGGVVAIVAYNMSEWHLVKSLLKSTRSDVLVMLTSFLLTVFVDLTVAIQAGVLLAAFLFIRRMGESTEARDITRLLVEREEEKRADDLGQPGVVVPPGVEVFEVYGALFFGAADKFKDTLLSHAHKLPRVLILRMRHVLMLDATALHSLEEVFAHTQARGVTLVLSGVTAQPLMLMVRSGFLDRIGQANVHSHVLDALARARELLAAPERK